MKDIKNSRLSQEDSRNENSPLSTRPTVKGTCKKNKVSEPFKMGPCQL